jgi:colicin import membrane protein
LRIKLAPDGTLLDVKSEGGDPAFCQLLAAARQAKIPKPPSQAVYETSKMRHWTSNLKLHFPRANGEK